MADILVEVDEWVGDIMNEVDKLGIAENTIIMVMGDNGPFMQYAGPTGQSDRIYRVAVKPIILKAAYELMPG